MAGTEVLGHLCLIAPLDVVVLHDDILGDHTSREPRDMQEHTASQHTSEDDDTVGEDSRIKGIPRLQK
jgi:hypothetical protein